MLFRSQRDDRVGWDHELLRRRRRRGGIGGVGGILGLLNLIEGHEEAIEYDLITLGLRLRYLGSESFTWRDLHVIVMNLPRNSALARSVDPRNELQSPEILMLAHVADMATLQVWAQTKDGEAGRNRPKPILDLWAHDSRPHGRVDSVSEVDIAALDEVFSRPRITA